MPRIKGLNRAGRVGATDFKFTGEEPEWNDADVISVEQFNNRIDRGLRFYSYYCDNKFFKTLIINWMKKNKYSKEEINAMSSAGLNTIPATAGKLIRMMDLGMPERHHADLERTKASDYVRKYINETLLSLSTLPVTDTPVEEKPKITASQKSLLKLEEVVFPELENLLDNLIELDINTKPTNIPTLNIKDLLRGAGIAPNRATPVIEWIHRVYTEFWEALEKKDEQLVEGYGYFSKPQLRRIVQNFGKLLEEAEEYSRVTKNPRKPRKKKIIPPEKQVAKMKIALENDNVKGENPENIVGAKRVYLYNTKYRKLTVLDAETPAGLTVKGSTVYGFNPGTSYNLTLRKPDLVIPEIQTKTPLQIEKVIVALKTKRGVAKGRTNDHTLIIRTIK